MREKNNTDRDTRIRQITEMLGGIKSDNTINRIYFFIQRLFRKEAD